MKTLAMLFITGWLSIGVAAQDQLHDFIQVVAGFQGCILLLYSVFEIINRIEKRRL